MFLGDRVHELCAFCHRLIRLLRVSEASLIPDELFEPIDSSRLLLEAGQSHVEYLIGSRRSNRRGTTLSDMVAESRTWLLYWGIYFCVLCREGDYPKNR